MTTIPFKKINLGKSYEMLQPLFVSGRIGYGEIVGQFEKELATYVGAKYALAVNSCTSALYISLVWEKMQGRVKSVSIPSMTQALVPNAILSAGLDLSFNDDTSWVGSQYLLRGSRVIDSAQQLRRNDFDIFTNLTKLCYSFYPTKPIGSIDGGAIVTNDEEFINWARSFIMYGRDQGSSYKNSWEYQAVMLGGKYNYNDVQAMICLEQLRRLDQTNEKRQEISDTYNKAFGLHNDSDYLYRIDVQNRDEFITKAKKRGIECGVHFQPLHLMGPFKEIVTENKEKIEVEYTKTVSLPFYDTMSEDEVSQVIDLVTEHKNNMINYEHTR